MAAVLRRYAGLPCHFGESNVRGNDMSAAKVGTIRGMVDLSIGKNPMLSRRTYPELVRPEEAPSRNERDNNTEEQCSDWKEE